MANITGNQAATGWVAATSLWGGFTPLSAEAIQKANYGFTNTIKMYMGFADDLYGESNADSLVTIGTLVTPALMTLSPPDSNVLSVHVGEMLYAYNLVKDVATSIVTASFGENLMFGRDSAGHVYRTMLLFNTGYELTATTPVLWCGDAFTTVLYAGTEAAASDVRGVVFQEDDIFLNWSVQNMWDAMSPEEEPPASARRLFIIT